MEAIKAALGDGLLTFMWVFSDSCLGIWTTIVATAVGVQGLLWASLFIITLLVFVLVFIFTLIGDVLGGASFNLTATATFYAAGLAPDTLFSMALRFPAQALGAVGGAILIKDVMPAQYKHMLEGPSLKVDLHTGAIAEGVLTFIISFAVLVIVMRGPRSSLLKTWLLAMSTVTLITVGSSFTGPSMNPANAFGWAYVNKWHDTWKQFYVYWICPFIGAISAAWIFRAMFAPPAAKEKKA